jgi:hypothetical protein
VTATKQQPTDPAPTGNAPLFLHTATRLHQICHLKKERTANREERKKETDLKGEEGGKRI